MLRVALTADWHYGVTLHSSVDRETQVPTRILDIERSVKHVLDYCRDPKKAIKRLVLAGDIYHVNNPPSTYIARSIAMLGEYLPVEPEPDNDLVIEAFDGNHDFNSKAGKRSATASLVEAFRDRMGFVWHDTAVLMLDWAEGVHAAFIPHGCHKPEIRFPDDEHVHVVFCHTSIPGAVMGAEEFLLADAPRALEGIEGRVDAYLSGHIHKPQTFSYQGALAAYPGSLERIDFGERAEEKSFIVVDLHALRTKGAAAIERIPVPTRPMVQMDVLVNALWDIDSLDIPDVQGALVKVVVKAHEKHLPLFNANAVREAIIGEGADYVAGFSMDIEHERVVRDSEMTERLTLDAALDRYVTRNLPHGTEAELRFVEAVRLHGTRIITEASRVGR